ncbi:MAG: phosphoribosylanthranilate isomerase [Gammaproteobacteria bacterium]|nr:phosphoribosylanthranilate isomerase [Gammaproteobacteria bacterium]
MWIKICGLTDARAVSTALELAVDAIGFVFAPSLRRLAPQQAAQLARPARTRLTCVAVMQHPSQAQLDEVLRLFDPDMLQTDFDDLAGLRLPATLARLPVVRAGSAPPGALPAQLLFEGPRSGSGATSDWTAAAAQARATQLVLAGGLNAANVAEAIRVVRPWGVDTSSGVEGTPGCKDPLKMQSFVCAARAASAEVGT